MFYIFIPFCYNREGCERETGTGYKVGDHRNWLPKVGRSVVVNYDPIPIKGFRYKSRTKDEDSKSKSKG